MKLIRLSSETREGGSSLEAPLRKRVEQSPSCSPPPPPPIQFAVVNVPDGGLSGLDTTLDHARAKAFGPLRRFAYVLALPPLTLRYILTLHGPVHAHRTITMPTVSPSSLLRKHYYPDRRQGGGLAVNHVAPGQSRTISIDYVSLDVEGHELEVMAR